MPKTNGTSSLKVGLAMLIFLGALAIIAVVKKHGTSLYPQEPVTNNNDSSAFFYDSIGKASNSKQQTTSEDHKFSVIVLTTAEKQEAIKAITKLEQIGIQAFYTRFSKQGYAFYRVQAGTFASLTAAEHTLKTITAAGLPAKLQKL